MEGFIDIINLFFENWGTWIAGILTLCVFSFLYNDNPFYKFAEHLAVGVSAGYIFVVDFQNYIIPKLYVPLVEEGNYIYLVPLILGIMMLTRLVPRYNWISRWPMAFTIGVSSGVAIPATFQARVVKQIQGSLTILNPFTEAGFSWEGMVAILALIGIITSLIYFYFSIHHKGAVGGVANIGMWYLMIGFGASFGYTVMARVSLLIGRIQFLMRDWLHLIE